MLKLEGDFFFPATGLTLQEIYGILCVRVRCCDPTWLRGTTGVSPPTCKQEGSDHMMHMCPLLRPRQEGWEFDSFVRARWAADPPHLMTSW